MRPTPETRVLYQVDAFTRTPFRGNGAVTQP